MRMPVHVGWVYGYRLETGGVERHLLSLMRHAPRDQFRFTFIGQGSEDFMDQARALGAGWHKWQTRCALDVRALNALASVFAAESVELVHTHSPNAMLLAGLAARGRNCPHVLTVHIPAYEFYPPNDWRQGLFQLAERLGQQILAQSVIYASQRTHAQSRRLGIAPLHKSCVIENGIELDIYSPAPPNTNTPPVIGCVARLEKQKGLDILLEAFAQLTSEACLWIIGDGMLRSELETHVQQLRLTQRVSFLGYQAQANDYLRQCDIFVLPSRFEGLSFALLEALALGLPCIVTDVGDHGRLINSGENGWVVPPNDPAALTTALESLLRDRKKRAHFSVQARNTAEKYSAEKMAQRTFAVYTRALNL